MNEQELRLQCIQLAAAYGHPGDTNDVISRAERLYRFVRDGVVHMDVASQFGAQANLAALNSDAKVRF